MPTIYQLDNAGLAVRTSSELWLVDALHGGAKSYGGLTQDALALMGALARGAKMPVRLFLTHLHADHASADAIRLFAARHPLAVYAADPAIKDWDLGGAALHLLPLDSQVHLADNSVRTITLPHLSPQEHNILHTALRLDVDGSSLFLSGDGMMDEHVFERNAEHILGVNAAVCLYSYAFTRRNLAFVRTHICPGRLVVNHFPVAAADEHDTLGRFEHFVAKEGRELSIIPFAQVGDKLYV